MATPCGIQSVSGSSVTGVGGALDSRSSMPKSKARRKLPAGWARTQPGIGRVNQMNSHPLILAKRARASMAFDWAPPCETTRRIRGKGFSRNQASFLALLPERGARRSSRFTQYRRPENGNGSIGEEEIMEDSKMGNICHVSGKTPGQIPWIFGLWAGGFGLPPGPPPLPWRQPPDNLS